MTLLKNLMELSKKLMESLKTQGTPEMVSVVSIAVVFCLLLFLVGMWVGLRMQRSKASGNRSGARRGSGDNAGGQKKNRKNDGDIEIYVGNLAYEVSDKDLDNAFAQYGHVVSARIIKNRFNGKSKGFGFVEMNNRDEVAAALSALNGKDIKGRKLIANEAKSRSRE